MSERQIEMFWRCSSCDHRNLGRHMVCQHCKSAKDGSERYEMPEDTASAATVTDEALLRMALAGPNWRCAYCDSDQRALDGSCRNCGASVPPLPDPGPASADSPEGAESLWGKLKRRRGCTALVLLVVFFGCCCPCLMNSSGSKTTEPTEQAAARNGPEWSRKLTVREVSWAHTVTVDRYQLVDEEGFAEDRPAKALQVQSRGKRHHHDEQVLVGHETVYFTESVQRGYDSESYTEREACGEDCQTTPEKCKETCTSNRNGFATCKTTCTGGGRSCTTRYCSVRKTRKVPRYVDERRSRQEPRYRTEAHSATWFGWKEWQWKFDRKVNATGATLETRWPTEAELRPVKPLAKGERERSERGGTYRVVLKDDAHPPVDYAPATLEEFQRFSPGSVHVVEKTGDTITVIAPKPPEPAPAPAPAPAQVAPAPATTSPAPAQTPAPAQAPMPVKAPVPAKAQAPARSAVPAK
ncbi:hypothetical protein LZ198_00380 [Myxococcus sp. K15C18031901]|uniref:hypothetical protein n=1 Tax=Myxococcus dinghuensis TaxID=2906761 RepID=UPI0020A83828|nr:hypothetical protein [Myxococcus dinghuensis]MCP3097320.1 hypothetical protein [Myxococcus dinghuensis]